MAVSRSLLLVVAALTIGGTACSSGDGDDDSVASGSVPVQTTPASIQGSDSTQIATTATGSEVPPSPAATVAPTPPPTPVVADTGVPGLDSDDSFCSAWSRFGGSWQVLIQVAAAGDPAQAARLEVIAAGLVADAYDDVFAAWPAELEPERNVVADAYFGAFQRRSADAAQALRDAGATDDDIVRLAATWDAALEQYDPASAVVAPDVPPELEPVVADAAGAFAERRVPLQEDPSMVITAETPMTDAFLATACPDQGWISGSDVVEGGDSV